MKRMTLAITLTLLASATAHAKSNEGTGELGQKGAVNCPAMAEGTLDTTKVARGKQEVAMINGETKNETKVKPPSSQPGRATN